MANTGVFGQSALAATTNTTIYTVGSTSSIVTISVINRDSVAAATVRLAVGTISNTSSPANSNFIEYDTMLPPNQIIERSGIALSNGQAVVAYANSASITVSVYGIEA